jgi:hypothetical protein
VTEAKEAKKTKTGIGNPALEAAALAARPRKKKRDSRNLDSANEQDRSLMEAHT